MTPAVSAVGLGKSFKVYPTPRDRLLEALTGKTRHQVHASLTDVSFTINRGEVVGIVGQNGAGKSTLLKLIANTLEPTAGKLEVDGRVTAILELGNGFHPEFTGRENIYLGGLCLGMTRAEIDRKMADIIAFAELEDYIDRPFKTYSTGMQSRLTFSTATSVEPDLLIIDEALSVGDARFQRKSFGRIEDFRRQGRTILLVSHDSTTITNFCDRALLFDHGRLLLDGRPGDVCNAYHKLLFGEHSTLHEEDRAEPELVPLPEPESMAVPDDPLPEEEPLQPAPSDLTEHLRGTQDYGTQDALISAFDVLGPDGKPVRTLHTGHRYRLTMTVTAQTDLPSLTAGMVVRSRKGVDLYGFDTDWGHPRPLLAPLKAGESVTVNADIRMNLAGGDYFVTFAIARRDGLKYHLLNDALELKVIGPRAIFTTSVVDLEARLAFDHPSARTTAYAS